MTKGRRDQQHHDVAPEFETKTLTPEQISRITGSVAIGNVSTPEEVPNNIEDTIRSINETHGPAWKVIEGDLI